MALYRTTSMCYCLVALLAAAAAVAALPRQDEETTTVDPAAVIPSGLPMAVGDTVRVQVHVDYIAGPVYLGLCGANSCSSVRVRGLKKGVMGYGTWRVAVNSVNEWASQDSVEVTEPVGPFLFTKNETMVFAVSLRADDGVLAVSVEGQDAVTATILPQAGETELKVLSYAGSALLLQGAAVTDGHAMAVGDQLAVVFCATGPGLVTAGLCGAKSCSYVSVYGLDQDGGLRYGSAVSLLRNQLTGLSEWVEQPEWTNSSFSAGEQRSFVVNRCSETEMRLWLAEAPDKAVSVPLDKERAVLKVLGQAGNVQLRSLTGGEPFFCPEPATPVTETLPPTTTASPPTSPPSVSSTPRASGASSLTSSGSLAAALAACLACYAGRN